jgi:hypothetical protein
MNSEHLKPGLVQYPDNEKCPIVEWSGFETPFEIQTKKCGF